MRVSLIFAPFLASCAMASGAPQITARQANNSCNGSVVLDSKTNIFKKYTLHPNSVWRKKALAGAEAIADTGQKKRALRAAEQGVFYWIENKNDANRLTQVVKDVPCDHVLGLVVSGLIVKKCPTFGVSDYAPNQYTYGYQAYEPILDPIVKTIKENPRTAFAIIIEPNVIGTVALNTQTMCRWLGISYRNHASEALRQLDLLNVVTYLDAAHGGWFGWNEYQEPGARELIDTWRAAGELKQFRGLAINVGSHNAWDLAPGEDFQGEMEDYDIRNWSRNEQRYLTILRKQIRKLNATDMPTNAIMDTTRNGVLGIRYNWDDWCNVQSAGFGHAPSAETKDEGLDAFVWVKEGGSSDGTSDRMSENFDEHCGRKNAFKPMPERGEWSQNYFEMLVKEWRPMGWPYENPSGWEW